MRDALKVGHLECAPSKSGVYTCAHDEICRWNELIHSCDSGELDGIGLSFAKKNIRSISKLWLSV